MYQSDLHFTFEFTILMIESQYYKNHEFNFFIFLFSIVLYNNYISRVSFSALYLHQHVNLKSPLHMIKRNHHDWHVVVLSNGMTWLHFTYEFMTLMIKSQYYKNREFNFFFFTMLYKNYISRGSFSALYLHQHVNLKSPFHMIKRNHHDWHIIVLSNRMSTSIIDYEQWFISYKVYYLYLLCDNLITHT
jgi:hypothetical protein